MQIRSAIFALLVYVSTFFFVMPIYAGMPSNQQESDNQISDISDTLESNSNKNSYYKNSMGKEALILYALEIAQCIADPSCEYDMYLDYNLDGVIDYSDYYEALQMAAHI
jgi:hypothetical protein